MIFQNTLKKCNIKKIIKTWIINISSTFYAPGSILLQSSRNTFNLSLGGTLLNDFSLWSIFWTVIKGMVQKLYTEFSILSKTHPPQLPGMKTEYNKTNSLPDAIIKCVQSFQVVLRFYCVQSVQCVLTDWLMLLSLMLISLMLYIQYVFNVYSMCIQYPIQYLHSLFYYIFIVCLNDFLLPHSISYPLSRDALASKNIFF